MQAMEEQQQRHMKEVYMDSALKSLANNPDNESISNLSFKSAYTQDTNTQIIKEMLTRANDLRKANAKNDNTEYYDLDMDPQLELEFLHHRTRGMDRLIYQIIFMFTTILVQLGILKTTTG